MIELANIQRVYFIGIGGIGMSALARYFVHLGKRVSGYDRTATDLTRQLVKEGIEVVYEDDVAAAPKDADLIVYTPAVPRDHRQLNYYRDHGFTVVKRSEVLGAITESSYNICVGGTHGKTTISTMIAHVLRHTGYGCNAFLGGIAANYNSNFWSSDRNLCVVEADEYDRSFLKLSPDVAIITATDADHLDIYETEEALQDAFVEFSERIKKGGTLFYKKGLPVQDRFVTDNSRSYSLTDKNADVNATNIQLKSGHYVFDVKVGDEMITDVTLNMGGMHNVENATVAIAVSRMMKIDSGLIKKAIDAFRGVKRRFEYIIKSDELVYIDDYAHHPAELQTLISSARNLFPQMKCVVAFQPHLFTRTRDLASGFAESLSLADEVILLPIYPARELPIEGVSSDIIAEKISYARVTMLRKDEVLNYVTKLKVAKDPLLLITAGAGDIDTLVSPLQNLLKSAS